MLYWKLPWPLRKKKKALATYREWANLSKWEWEEYERYTYGAEMLMGMGKDFFHDYGYAYSPENNGVQNLSDGVTQPPV